MNRITGTALGLFGMAALGASSGVLADNPLGAYIGAGVGGSSLTNKNGTYNPGGYSGDFTDHDATWKLIAGLRPIPFVGAEVEYIDFGNAGGNSGFYGANYDYSVSSHPKATVLYGMGYLPIPLPFLDVYGKLGVAHLQTNNSYSFTAGCVPAPGTTCQSFQSRFDENFNKFAYGAGVQAKFQDFAFRGEYERVSSSFGDPSAYTLSVTWTF
jgi:opacity protein-like surface antigen